MKRILTIGLLFCIVISKAQTSAGDEAAVQMLKNCYMAYLTIYSNDWSAKDGNARLIKRLDSVQTVYCTTSFKKQINDLFKTEGLDHDYLLNDLATDMAHLNTLGVSKDPSEPNGFTVSYVAVLKDMQGKSILRNNLINVTVVKQNNRYKIAKAYGDNIR